MGQSAMIVKQSPQGREKRKSRRQSLSLPVLIETAGGQQSAQLHNLSESGAMIEASISLRLGSSLILNCGTIGAKAVVVWDQRPRWGVRFTSFVDKLDIAHQVMRSQAAASRRERRKVERAEDDVSALGAH